MEVGVAALGEGAQEVQRRRRLAVGLQHPLRVGAPRLGAEIGPVDDVAAIGGRLLVALPFRLGGAGLGELAREAADLHHRAGGAVGEHDRHLQEDAERVPDVVRVELGEAFRAVAALKQEGAAGRDVGERRLEAPRLAGEDERREVPERPLDRLDRFRIRIGRRLADRPRPPGFRGPFLHDRRKLAISVRQHQPSRVRKAGTGEGRRPAGVRLFFCRGDCKEQAKNSLGRPLRRHPSCAVTQEAGVRPAPPELTGD